MGKHYKFSEIVQWTPKQTIANEVADSHKFTLYGGAAGGGKSYWLRWYALRYLINLYKHQKLRGVQVALFSEDYPTLKDRHLGKIALELPLWMGTLKEDKAHGLCVKLDPSLGGGVLLLRNLDAPEKYMSTEFALVAVDELTMNYVDVFNNLRARLRWPGIPMPKFIAGSNPGNKGHDWVKNLWIDRNFPTEEQEPEQFAYVRALVDDNPHVDPNYIRALESLPEKMRKALREGSWDIFEGQFFTEFNRDVHVVPTILNKDLPAHWPRIRMIDVSGRNGTSTCYWMAIDQDGTAWIYREYWMKGLDSDEHAKNMWEMSHWQDEREQWHGEDYKYTVMDTAAWAKLGLAESTAEVYLRIWAELDEKNAVNNTDSLVQAQKNREFGWDAIHQYLRHDLENKVYPQMKIMENCRNLIRTCPLLVISEKNSNDVEDAPGIDDGWDAVRYGVVTLRDQRTSENKQVGVENIVQRRLREIKEKANQTSYNYFKMRR